MTDNNLDAWLEEYGQMPLIQVLMPPPAVKLVATLLAQAGVEIQLHPTDLGEGEPPTLTAIPSGPLMRRLLAVDPEVLAADQRDNGSPDAETLERLTGFYRRPVSELPPDYRHD